jgi:hypothetical protein
LQFTSQQGESEGIDPIGRVSSREVLTEEFKEEERESPWLIVGALLVKRSFVVLFMQKFLI